MDALTNWVALSSGNGDNGVTQVPGALLDLLRLSVIHISEPTRRS